MVICQSDAPLAFPTDEKFHVLIGCTGSVATIKLADILRQLSRYSKSLSVRCILTKCAMEFLRGANIDQPCIHDLKNIPNVEAIYTDEDEWSTDWKRNVGILHIELRRWAHVLVVAPLSANTMAKIVMGLCDNLLTTVIRAWDVRSSSKIIILAPAMNTYMWEHPVTQKQLEILKKEWSLPCGGWIDLIEPQFKKLACGDMGIGAMCEHQRIVERILELYDKFQDDNGKI